MRRGPRRSRVAGVVVLVAGEHEPHLLGRLPEHDRDEVVQRRVGPGSARPPASTQLGFAVHRMMPSPSADVLGDAPEVVDLGRVDVGVELDVDADQPPPLRQLDREVAAPLLGPPAADPPALAEEPQERGQAVVPVVVAGDGEQRRRLVGVGERRVVGALGPLLVRLVDAAGRPGPRPSPAATRVVWARCRSPDSSCDVQLGLPQQVGHGVGRVEAVAEVADVVQPSCCRSEWSWNGRQSAAVACTSRLSAYAPKIAESATNLEVDELPGAEPTDGAVPGEGQFGQASGRLAGPATAVARRSRTPGSAAGPRPPQLAEEQPAERLEGVGGRGPLGAERRGWRMKSGTWIVMRLRPTTRPSSAAPGGTCPASTRTYSVEVSAPTSTPGSSWTSLWPSRVSALPPPS